MLRGRAPVGGTAAGELPLDDLICESLVKPLLDRVFQSVDPT
jgi:hypothetical protein